MSKSDILDPTATFVGQFGTKSMDDVLGVWRVHSNYKNLKMRFVIDAREKLMDEVRALEFDASSRLLGKALRASNDYITADPDPNRVRVIILIHGGGNDGEAELLSQQLKRAKEAKVAIHTVAVGKKAERSLLKQISSRTGGRYFQVKNGADLSSAMTPIMENIDRARDDKPLLAQEKFRKKKPKKKRKKQIKDEDEDNERKRKKRRRKKREQEDEDEDEDEDDDDDEPKKKKDSGSLLWLWILLILLVLAGGGVGLFFLLRKKPVPSAEEAPAFPNSDASENFYAGAFFAGDDAPAASSEPAGFSESVAPAPRAHRPLSNNDTGGSSIVVFEPTTAEGERFEMGAAATTIRVGRKGENNIQLVHRGVSGRHAELHWIDGRVRLTDLQSTNGTFVNGKRISEVELHSGDELRFDAVGFRVVYGAKAAPKPKPEPSLPPAQDRTMMLSEEELAALTPPPEDDAPVANDFDAQEPVVELAHMYCMRHKNRIAQQSCDMCNRPYCSECLSSVLDQQICFRCRTQGAEG